MACQIPFKYLLKLMYNTIAKMCCFSNLYRPIWVICLKAQLGITTFLPISTHLKNRQYDIYCPLRMYDALFQ